MTHQLENRAQQGRTRISLSQDWEVRHWTEKFGVSVDQLMMAVEKVGPLGDDVEQYFSQSQRSPQGTRSTHQ